MVIGLCLLGAFLVNKASADLIDIIYYDHGKKVLKTSAAKQAANTTLALANNSKQQLQIVKIGSHVLRNQLLLAGCVDALEFKFLKCPQNVLDRELERYNPVR